MYAALEVNISNYANAIVSTNEVIDAIDFSMTFSALYVQLGSHRAVRPMLRRSQTAH
jgi:hypothetical protein